MLNNIEDKYDLSNVSIYYVGEMFTHVFFAAGTSTTHTIYNVW